MGTIGKAKFTDIETFGDGAVGIQISQPVGDIIVKNNVVTHGGVGKSLVNGLVLKLSADAISIKKGGKVDSLSIGGDIITHGKDVQGYVLHQEAEVKQFELKGEIKNL